MAPHVNKKLFQDRLLRGLISKERIEGEIQYSGEQIVYLNAAVYGYQVRLRGEKIFVNADAPDPYVGIGSIHKNILLAERLSDDVSLKKDIIIEDENNF